MVAFSSTSLPSSYAHEIYNIRKCIVSVYCSYIAGKFGRGKLGKFGDSSAIFQTETIQSVTTIINNVWLIYLLVKLFLAKLFTHLRTYFCQTLLPPNFLAICYGRQKYRFDCMACVC